MTGKRLTPMDAMFLYGETPETMMHVGGLLPFTMPPDAEPDYLRRLMEEIRTTMPVFAPFNTKLKTPGFLLNPAHQWVPDPDFDIEYHVRRSALPRPGDERELGILVSRLHSNPLDLTRPPWEMHLIEGLENNRFAIYVKFHHALVDGYSGMQLLIRSLSTDPDSRSEQLFFSLPPLKREPRPEHTSAPLADVSAVLGRAVTVAKSVPSLAKSLVGLQLRRDGEFKDLISSYEAPHSVLNARIGRNRRFATQQYEVNRLSAVARAAGATMNDVVLAICGGGLRQFLLESGQLGDKPLISFLPVNVRAKGDLGGGNAVGAILATLGTDIADPVERIETITRSTRTAKKQLTRLPMESILAYSAMLMAPSATQVLAAMTGLPAPVPFTFNLCVSNVPGPRDPLYFRGARLEANYPLSIPIHGMALNITCQSYAGTLNFGFIGDRDALPHLQRLAVYTGAALEELEVALGLSPADAPAGAGETVGTDETAVAGTRKAAAPKAAAARRSAPNTSTSKAAQKKVTKAGTTAGRKAASPTRAAGTKATRAARSTALPGTTSESATPRKAARKTPSAPAKKATPRTRKAT